MWSHMLQRFQTKVYALNQLTQMNKLSAYTAFKAVRKYITFDG